MITIYLCILIFFLTVSHCGIVHLNQVIHLSDGRNLFQKRLISIGDDLVSEGDDFESLAEIKFQFQSYLEGANGDELLEIVAFHSSKSDYFLSCCTEQLVSEGKCGSDEIGMVAFVNDSLVFRRSYNFSDGEFLTVSDSFLLNEAGYWYFYVINCGSEDIQVIDGYISWIDSVGYLLIENYPLLPAHIIMGSFLYLVALAWIIHLCIYNENIMGIQYFLFALIIVAAFEQTFETIEMLVYNSNGTTNDFLLFAGVLFTSLKLSLSRLALMLIGLGLSITKPVLPSNTYVHLATITFVYALIEGINQYLQLDYHYGYLGLEAALIIFQILIVVINIIYLGWMGYETLKTMNSLHKSKEVRKYRMYQYTVSLLFFLLLISIAVYGVDIYIFDSEKGYDDLIPLQWIVRVYWEFLHLTVISFVAWIWRPKKNNLRYAFMDRVTFDTEKNSGSSIELEETDIAEIDIDNSTSSLSPDEIILTNRIHSTSSTSIDLS